jgi:hypothetical protein
MSLPEQIPVRYTEEEAGYVSMRPVVKQVFRLNELTDMVVSVAGKDAARVQQIFHSGTVVYNGYRYWWDGISAELREIEQLLTPFPDDDSARPFDPSKAVAVLLEIGGGTQRSTVEINREEASQKKLFAKSSPWAFLLRVAESAPPRYEKYSYSRKGDLFRLTLPHQTASNLIVAMRAVAPRSLRHRWSTLRPPAAIMFVLPRK